MRILSLHHIQLAMPAGGENQARAFYQGLLGLTEVAKPPELAGRGGVWFEDGPVRLHLGVEADFRPALKAHPAFQVASLADVIVVLRKGGAVVTADANLPSLKRIFTADPFGNRIELLQLL